MASFGKHARSVEMTTELSSTSGVIEGEGETEEGDDDEEVSDDAGDTDTATGDADGGIWEFEDTDTICQTTIENMYKI